MGGLVIEQIRPGVEFTPDAAAAFLRAEGQVWAELGRLIRVTSTYRSWAKQLQMHLDWNAYVDGYGPYPGHSKAVHPSESFHVAGTALDSPDWTNARIVQILADHGFIRNRLHVPNEKHHFEYIRARDNHIGEEPIMPISAEDRKAIARDVWTYKSARNGLRFGDMLRAVYDSVRYGKKGVRTHGELTAKLLSTVGSIQLQLEDGGAQVDVDALAEALADQLPAADAERLAATILARMGEKLTAGAEG